MITWVIVAFNSMDSALELARSVKAQDPSVQVLIGCNGAEDWSPEAEGRAAAVDVRLVHPGENLGYTGLLSSIEHDIPADSTVVLSNADLELEAGFVDEVRASITRFPHAVMLAPSIVGAAGHDQNPHLLSEPPASKLLALAALHRFPPLADLVLLRRHGHSSRPRTGVEGQVIHAGHGSCLVFTPRFRQLGGSHDYPCFLFGEELWYGQESARIGGEIRYVPAARARHREHESTGRRRRGAVAQAKYDSLVYWSSRLRSARE